MSYYKVADTELIGVANAIRSKAGQSASLVWPDGFVSAVGSIPQTGALGSKTISANGSYSAAADNLDGFDNVVVNVPNTYAAGDEGKVVQSGALVAQTSQSISSNGTYDTTTKNQIAVNVSGGEELQTPLDLSYLPNSVSADVVFSNDAKKRSFAGYYQDTFVPLYTVSPLGGGDLYKNDGQYLRHNTQIQKENGITVYVVLKLAEPFSGTRAIVQLPAGGQGKNPNFYANGGTVYSSVDTNDTNEDISANSDFHLYTISIDATTNTAHFYIDGVYKRSKGYSDYSTTVCIACAAGTNYSSNADILYYGCVEGTESEQTIVANHQTIMQKLGLSA